MSRETPAPKGLRPGLLLFLLFLLPVIAQATPIVSFGTDLEIAPKSTAKSTTKKARKTAVMKSEASVARSAIIDPSLCEFSNTCVPTLKVPEPQSVVLLGSSFLLLAGLLRRRFNLVRL
jgi:hypothetical protein